MRMEIYIIHGAGKQDSRRGAHVSLKPACHIKRVNKTLYMKGRYDANKNFVTLGEVFETSRKESPMRNRRSLKRF